MAVADAKEAEGRLLGIHRDLQSLLPDHDKTWTPPHSSRTSVEDLRERMASCQLRTLSLRQALEGERNKLLSVRRAAKPFSSPGELQNKIDALEHARRMAEARRAEALRDALLRYVGFARELPFSEDDYQFIYSELQSGGLSGIADKLAANPLAPRGSAEWMIKTSEYQRRHDEVWTGALAGIKGTLRSLEHNRDSLAKSHDSKLVRDVDESLASQAKPLTASTHDLVDCMAEAVAIIEGERRALECSLQPWHEALRASPQVNLRSEELDEEDGLLVRKWKGDGDGYWERAMESARRAERAALSLYKELNGRAVDLSILQVRKPSDERWKGADIDSGGRLIDVKNSRRAFSSPGTYSEHCVPEFKKGRGGSNVVVSAFLSEYLTGREEHVVISLPAEGYANHTRRPWPEVVWIGETAREELNRLSDEFESDSLRIELGRKEHNLLPPWIFDYPESVYAERSKALAKLEGPNAAWPMVSCPSGAVVLASAVPDDSGDDTLTREALALQRRLSRSGLSRPMLFLHILERFCCGAKEGEPASIEDIRALLFPSSAHFLWEQVGAGCDDYTTVPLGVMDPLRTIESLLGVLESVQQHCMRRMLGFRSFRLRGPSILQGLNEGEAWSTILAYCGGWRRLDTGTRVRCGNNPLYLGKHMTCPECLRLICDMCQHCTAGCRLCAKRQKQ